MNPPTVAGIVHTRSDSGYGTLGYVALVAVAGLSASTGYFAAQTRASRAQLREVSARQVWETGPTDPQSDDSLRATLSLRPPRRKRRRSRPFPR